MRPLCSTYCSQCPQPAQLLAYRAYEPAGNTYTCWRILSLLRGQSNMATKQLVLQATLSLCQCQVFLHCFYGIGAVRRQEAEVTKDLFWSTFETPVFYSTQQEYIPHCILLAVVLYLITMDNVSKNSPVIKNIWAVFYFVFFNLCSLIS